jgi:hypothetical protein
LEHLSRFKSPIALLRNLGLAGQDGLGFAYRSQASAFPSYTFSAVDPVDVVPLKDRLSWHVFLKLLLKDFLRGIAQKIEDLELPFFLLTTFEKIKRHRAGPKIFWILKTTLNESQW